MLSFINCRSATSRNTRGVAAITESRSMPRVCASPPANTIPQTVNGETPEYAYLRWDKLIGKACGHHNMRRRSLFLSLVCSFVLQAKSAVDFESGARAILAPKCVACHGATAPQGELDLRSAEAVVKGGTSGPP